VKTFRLPAEGYITRVEGHGRVRMRVSDGVIEELALDIPESPRFFEAMLVGRSILEAREITSRICGICSVGHTLASLQATECALGLGISPQTMALRKLLLHGETVQSHILHVYFLVTPDLLGVGSVIPLAKTHRPVVERALRLKKLANDICDLVGGRAVHPITCVPGGFTKLPRMDDLKAMRDRMLAAQDDIDATVELFSTLDLPAFERETEYVALVSDDEYAFYEGEIGSSDCGCVSVQRYREVANEYVVPHSTAKHARYNRESYAVGALARWNLNRSLATPKAEEAGRRLGIADGCVNPFSNNLAQIAECAHALEDGVRIIEELIADGIEEERPSVVTRAGVGTGAVEVPRGLLVHFYECDSSGAITAADCVIPTAQNLANIEADMRAYAPTLLDRSPEEIKAGLEMLVRAYDPCISCSTHLLDLRLV
jgi:sulfhydrogenase subunit alpha